MWEVHACISSNKNEEKCVGPSSNLKSEGRQQTELKLLGL